MKIINKSILIETKKVLVIYLIVLLLLGRFSPLLVLAEEPEGTPPPETQQTEPSPSPEPEVNLESSPPPTPSPTPETEIDNEAEVNNDVDSTAISGENSIEEPSPTPSPSPEATPEVSPSPTPEASSAVIDTGDAVSVVEAENSVNSTEVNSQVVYQTLNIFTAGDIDLTTVPLAIAEAVFSQNNNDPVINVSVIDSQNFAYLSNDIISLANTGGNTIEGGQEATINTGDAYSIVSLLNKVNATIIDSTIHIVTINIFGNVEGNILLPEFSTGDACCGEVVHIEDKAVVNNDVDSAAISGQNSITSTNTENASIKTGSATSTVNLVNIVNTNLIGVIFHYLFINTFGTWTGDFLGWDNFDAVAGGGNLSLNSVSSGNGGNTSCPSCFDEISVKNDAQVVNNVSSTANTGGNTINNNGQATINTGNAYSSVSIVNFVNSSIINSLGFFGFINIFGFLDGDIGGASLFATPPPSEPEPEPEVENASNQDPGPSVREEGGQLEVYQTTNVGTHVLPGDTITFFVTIKNPGTGRVYDPELKISFIKDGVDMGGATFDLDDIEAGKGVKITTGLVLSEEAEPGEYIARAVATGHVGPDNNLISAYAESPFIIGGGSLPLMSGVTEEVQAAEPEGEILGAMTTDKGLTITQRLWLLLFGSLVAYLVMKAIRERRKLALAWSHRRSFLSSKGATIHSIVMRLSSFLS